MDDGGVPMRASASLRDVAAVAAAVEAAEARLSALSAVGAPACDDDEPQQAPTMRVRSLSSPRANHVRRAAPDPSAALLLSVRATQAPCARISRALHLAGLVSTTCSASRGVGSAPPEAHMLSECLCLFPRVPTRRRRRRSSPAASSAAPSTRTTAQRSASCASQARRGRSAETRRRD